jgi:hypothetical protein
MLGTRRALALVSAFCLLPAVVHAEDPYADFRVPDHRSFSWIVQSNGTTNLNLRNQGTESSRDRALNGALRSQMTWASESEARQRALVLATNASWFYDHSRATNAFPAQLFQSSEHQRADRQDLTLAASQRSYLGASEFAMDGQVTADLDFEQDGRSDVNASFLTPPAEDVLGEETQDRVYRHQGSVSLGIGRGRVRDVTGVFSAQLIEQRLLATGRLTRALSDPARLRLAQLHYLSSDFFAAHERPGRYFWREAERVLREDGALSDSTLDAYSLERVLEPTLPGVQFTRRTGWFVRPFFFGSETRGHADQDFRSDHLLVSSGVVQFHSQSEFSARNKLDRKDSGVGLSAEYHRPVGMRWQSDASAGASYGRGPLRELDVNASAGLQYLLADRWYASATFQESVRSQRTADGRSQPSWFLQSRANLSYLVEDSWSIDLHYTDVQGIQRDVFASFPADFLRSSGFSFGLTYRPFGRFDAPGLGLSEHLTTPAL